MTGASSTPVQIDPNENRWHSQHDRDAGREPCPDRIIEDLGSAFGMGCFGGFLWNFGKGYRNSPKGERIRGALFSGKSRAPILGGNFAVWGGTFSLFDCSLQYIRRTDDWCNNVASGFLTGGVLAARGGWRQCGRNAVMGGVILAIIEGVSALLVRSTAKTPAELQKEQLEMERQQREWEESQRLAAANRGGGNSGGGGLLGGMNMYNPFGSSSSSSTSSSSSGNSGFSFGSLNQATNSSDAQYASEFSTPVAEFAPEGSTGSYNSNNDSAGLVPEAGSGGGGGSGESSKGGWW